MATHDEIDVDSIPDLESAKAIIRILLERIRILEERVARLEKNSSTSSKPPSLDITKPANEQRQSGRGKIGAQARHPGKQREMLPPERVDRSETLRIDACPDCGHTLEEPAEPISAKRALSD